MRALIVASALGLGACTAPNPAYEDSGPGESTTQGTATSSTSTTDPTSADGSTGVIECEPGELRPLAITVTNGDSIVEPDCSDPSNVLEYPLGSNFYNSEANNLLIHELCADPMCECLGEPPQIAIELADQRVFADGVPLPDCGRVQLWARQGPERCEWAGVMLWNDGDAVTPWYIASRTLDIPPLEAFGLTETLELVDDESCEGLEVCSQLDRRPGHYALDVLGYGTVTMSDTPRFVELPFGVPGSTNTYLFDNRMAWITRECELQVSWTAQLWQ